MGGAPAPALAVGYKSIILNIPVLFVNLDFVIVIRFLIDQLLLLLAVVTCIPAAIVGRVLMKSLYLIPD